MWLEGFLWLAGIAMGAVVGWYFTSVHHRKRLREMEDRYTRITDAPTRATGAPVGTGPGTARVTKARVRHKRGSVQD